MTHSPSVAPSTDSGAAPEPYSLLRMSALDRLLGASVVVALLWAGVYWALH